MGRGDGRESADGAGGGVPRSVDLHLAHLFHGDSLATARSLVARAACPAREESLHAALLLCGADLEQLRARLCEDWRDLIVASGVRTEAGRERLRERGVRLRDTRLAGSGVARVLGPAADRVQRRLAAVSAAGSGPAATHESEPPRGSTPLPLPRRLAIAAMAVAGALVGACGYALVHVLVIEPGTPLHTAGFGAATIGTLLAVAAMAAARARRRAVAES